jgi:hypothetical protein
MVRDRLFMLIMQFAKGLLSFCFRPVPREYVPIPNRQVRSGQDVVDQQFGCRHLPIQLREMNFLLSRSQIGLRHTENEVVMDVSFYTVLSLQASDLSVDLVDEGLSSGIGANANW